MTIDKMREEFEAWTADHGFFGGCYLNRNPEGGYHDVDMQYAWESWQASRAALVIELPTRRDEGYPSPRARDAYNLLMAVLWLIAAGVQSEMGFEIACTAVFVAHSFTSLYWTFVERKAVKP